MCTGKNNTQREIIEILQVLRSLCSLIALGSTACYAVELTANSRSHLNASVHPRAGVHKQLTRVASQQGETTDIPEPAMPLLMGTGLMIFSVLGKKLSRSKAGAC